MFQLLKATLNVLSSSLLHKVFNIFSPFFWGKTKDLQENKCFLPLLVPAWPSPAWAFLREDKENSRLITECFLVDTSYLLNASLGVFSFICSLRLKKRLLKSCRSKLFSSTSFGYLGWSVEFFTDPKVKTKDDFSQLLAASSPSTHLKCSSKVHNIFP